jgi:hypothetical protein
MANIQQILGTDSISASRTVINDNFSAINAELGDILNYLDTTNLTLSAMSLVESDQIVAVGAADLSASGNVFSVTSEFTSSLEMSAAIYKSAFVALNSFPAALTNVHGTIKLETGISAFNLPAGASDGHEITLFSNVSLTDGISNATDAIFGLITGVDFVVGGTLTLRYHQSIPGWIVVSNFGNTIA